jgi:aspartate/methionine/tyrosine aminotransferase
MNAPVQWALPLWLEKRSVIQEQIRARTAGNLAELDRALAGQAECRWVTRLEVEGGWYAVLRIPATRPDEKTVRDLLEAGVWVHPGHFFGMRESGWLLVSLLTPAEEFSRGIALVLGYFQETQRSYLNN